MSRGFFAFFHLFSTLQKLCHKRQKNPRYGYKNNSNPRRYMHSAQQACRCYGRCDQDSRHTDFVVKSGRALAAYRKQHCQQKKPPRSCRRTQNRFQSDLHTSHRFMEGVAHASAHCDGQHSRSHDRGYSCDDTRNPAAFAFPVHQWSGRNQKQQNRRPRTTPLGGHHIPRLNLRDHCRQHGTIHYYNKPKQHTSHPRRRSDPFSRTPDSQRQQDQRHCRVRICRPALLCPGEQNHKRHNRCRPLQDAAPSSHRASKKRGYAADPRHRQKPRPWLAGGHHDQRRNRRPDEPSADLLVRRQTPSSPHGFAESAIPPALRHNLSMTPRGHGASNTPPVFPYPARLQTSKPGMTVGDRA